MNSVNFLGEDFFSRSNLINYLVSLYGYKSYLEIGVNEGVNFESVNAAYKVGVDPADTYDKITYNVTSDEFFEINKETFDIIFIDGSHLSEQVIKDIENSLNILNPTGTIVMHDCIPTVEEAQLRERVYDHWNGDVWKAFAYYRQNPNLTMFTIDTDQGLGIIKKGKQEPYVLPENLDFKYYRKNVMKLMNLANLSSTLRVLKELHKNGF
jgi:TPP-dependent indolepyruvate ferredoxin oxidoreductase alpha subunit